MVEWARHSTLQWSGHVLPISNDFVEGVYRAKLKKRTLGETTNEIDQWMNTGKR